MAFELPSVFDRQRDNRTFTTQLINGANKLALHAQAESIRAREAASQNMLKAMGLAFEDQKLRDEHEVKRDQMENNLAIQQLRSKRQTELDKERAKNTEEDNLRQAITASMSATQARMRAIEMKGQRMLAGHTDPGVRRKIEASIAQELGRENDRLLREAAMLPGIEGLDDVSDFAPQARPTGGQDPELLPSGDGSPPPETLVDPGNPTAQNPVEFREIDRAAAQGKFLPPAEREIYEQQVKEQRANHPLAKSLLERARKLAGHPLGADAAGMLSNLVDGDFTVGQFHEFEVKLTAIERKIQEGDEVKNPTIGARRANLEFRKLQKAIPKPTIKKFFEKSRADLGKDSVSQWFLVPRTPGKGENQDLEWTLHFIDQDGVEKSVATTEENQKYYKDLIEAAEAVVINPMSGAPISGAPAPIAPQASPDSTSAADRAIQAAKNASF